MVAHTDCASTEPLPAACRSEPTKKRAAPRSARAQSVEQRQKQNSAAAAGSRTLEQLIAEELGSFAVDAELRLLGLGFRVRV